MLGLIEPFKGYHIYFTHFIDYVRGIVLFVCQGIYCSVISFWD